jgi:hypothetical protein
MQRGRTRVAAGSARLREDEEEVEEEVVVPFHGSGRLDVDHGGGGEG